MYFSNFPYTYYSVDDGANVKVVTNITLRAVVNEEIKNNFSLYDEYDVLDGETPEIVADRFYNNPTYHWVILHINDILDPRFDWPLSSASLVSYAQGKYSNIYATHHYEDSNGYIVESDTSGATPVSNFTYEDRLNDEKRRIKILKPQYVSTVVSEFNKKLQV